MKLRPGGIESSATMSRQAPGGIEVTMRLMSLVFVMFTFLVGFALVAPSRAADKPLETVASVDLDRYLGRWYEIASYPAWFQKNCTAVTADYSLREDGGIGVVNSCRKGALDGKLKQAKGHAKVVDTTSNARLKVSFFWPFWGPYWIIDLDPDYQWAVVGEPNRKYLWILSRTPQMEDEVYEGIVSRLRDQGYDPARLNRTLQPSVGDAE
jgi:apolipoprotein D and lipocalin family protein